MRRRLPPARDILLGAGILVGLLSLAILLDLAGNLLTFGGWSFGLSHGEGPPEPPGPWETGPVDLLRRWGVGLLPTVGLACAGLAIGALCAWKEVRA